jgi:pimeloyl-ACP methyl ester carboxylesterase
MQTSIRFSRRRSIGAAILLSAAGWLSSTVPAPALAAGASGAEVTHVSAPTRYVDVDGARLAYRRFGKPGGVPLILCQHFVGTMDSWDPKVVDGLARGREVILFDSAGVAGSGGTVPTTIEGMANYGAGLLRALNIRQADVLGFSMGSLVAQQLALDHPETVRRVILVGSGPRAGVGMATLTPEFQEVLGKKRENPDDLLLDVFFTPSEESQAAGRAFVQRLHARTVDRDKDIDDKVAPAQVAAFAAWGKPQDDGYLTQIRQPVMVVSGSHDIVHYTVNSYNLQQKLPNAELIVYPDSNHGAIYQYPDRFIAQATMFLDGVAASRR